MAEHSLLLRFLQAEPDLVLAKLLKERIRIVISEAGPCICFHWSRFFCYAKETVVIAIYIVCFVLDFRVLVLGCWCPSNPW